MEEQLDVVSSGKIQEWATLCKTCYDEIKQMSSPIKNIPKQSYVIEDGYEYIFEKYGPAIKHTLEDGTVEYLPAKKEISVDLEKLKNKEYKLEQLLEIQSSCLGKHEGEDIYVKTGRYGPYVEWGERRESIKPLITLETPLESITLIEIQTFLEEKKTDNVKTSLRVLNHDMCIKKGKFGAYVYYKRQDMKKPEFLNIKTFKEGFLTCDSNVLVAWLCEKYNLPTPTQ
jgi:DNA topoisomerase-1